MLQVLQHQTQILWKESLTPILVEQFKEQEQGHVAVLQLVMDTVLAVSHAPLVLVKDSKSAVAQHFSAVQLALLAEQKLLHTMKQFVTYL